MRDDTYWKLATVGMQPENESEIDTDNTEFSSKEDRKLDPDKPEMEQMQKILKELLFSKRPSASEFYDAAGENIYKKYLSEIVKRRRYAD